MKRFFVLTISLLLILLLCSFSATAFANNSNEPAFENIIITYTVEGRPILDSLNADEENQLTISRSTVTATTMAQTWFNNDRRLNNEFFIIPSGRKVTVHETDRNYGSVKVTYLGHTGWVHGSNLRFP